jgi:limonene 1,2-monooxygenase
MAVPGNNVKEMISFVNDSGFGAIGTPDMVTAQIDRLMTQSNGGFGAYLMLAHNWADPRATQRSYELIARHVMPHFQGHAQQTLDAAARARAVRSDLAAQQQKAVEVATEAYAKDKASRVG